MKSLRVILLEKDGATRRILMRMLDAHEYIQVVGMAVNSMMVKSHARSRCPDVILTCDHDELHDAVDHIKSVCDAPVLVLSPKIIPSIRQSGAYAHVHTLKIPAQGIPADASELLEKIYQTLIKIAAPFEKTPTPTSRKARTHPQQHTRPSPQARGKPVLAAINSIIAIGSSTGGTEALSQVLKQLDVPHSAVVIVQHIPAAFGAGFAQKLNRICPMEVIEATDGMTLLQHHVYMGVGAEHFFLERKGSEFMCRIQGSDKISGHCPSVDVLFDSVAQHAGSKAVGALLTGMGQDGAKGLKKMREARARTLAQDEATSVVWGMPGTAVKIGAAEEQAPLSEVARRLMQLADHGLS